MKRKFYCALATAVILTALTVFSACNPKGENITLTYIVNGEVYETAEIAGDGRVSLPTPTVKGYVFDGWYYDSGYTKPFVEDSLSNSPEKDNLKVFARFKHDLSYVFNSRDFIELPIIELPSAYKTVVDRTDSYLGHPDLVLTDDGKLITMYPLGHGRGQITARVSDDFGESWSERVQNLPESFKNSQETPTLYNLRLTDGSSKLVLISGCPSWPGTGIKANGFNFSYSSDNGESWFEFENFHSPADAIVAMSSLTQIKENGAFVDKWMGTFHDHSFNVYKSYLTFEGNRAVWSAPEPLMPENARTARLTGLCEVEIIRNPENDVLIMIGRANKRITNSLISFSYDEGASWTQLTELPYELCGDRHKAEYDPESGKLIISFRQYVPEKRTWLSNKKGLCDGWYAWVGTFDDLMSYADSDPSNDKTGEYLISLGETFNNDADCGYSGVVCKDGNFVLVSYGKFDKNDPNPYIIQAKFKLSDLTVE